MASTTLRLGVIGTGLAVEQLHWPALERMTDRYQVAAFSDIDRDHAAHFAEYTGASMDDYTADYHELLARDDVDAVLISLPIDIQAQVLRDTIEAGKHVICEKPPGGNEDEARALLDVERAHPDVTVLIAENYFYKDDVRLAKSLVESGAIGRVHLLAYRQVSRMVPKAGEFPGTPWRQEGNYVGGVHLDGGVHQTAQIRMLMGDVAWLAAATQDANPVYGGPSDLTMTLRFVSGAAGTYTSTQPDHFVPEEPNDMRLYGTDGTLAIGSGEVTLYREGETETYTFGNMDGGYFGEFLNFHEAVTAGAEVVGTLAQSIRTMEMVTKAIRSAESGQVMHLDDDPAPLSERPLPLWLPNGATSLDLDMKREVSTS
jgi:predicted dehydrogenase